MRRLYWICGTAAVLFLAAEAMAAEKLYLCKDVYQNRPCNGEAEPLNLPNITRFDSDVGETTAPDREARPAERAGARARLGTMPQPPEPAVRPERSERPDTERIETPVQQVSRLRDQAASLRRNVNTIVSEQGSAAAQRKLLNLVIALDRVCSGPETSQNWAIRDGCNRARRDIAEARQYVRSLS